MYKGIITALVTPFSNQLIDYKTLEKLILWQKESGIKSIVVAGSTGEGNSLSDDEYFALVKQSHIIASSDIKIIAAISSSNTKKALEKAIKICEMGIADGLMCTMPHYVRAPQEGIVAHFTQLHDYTNLPIMLYSQAKRTGSEFSDESLIELSRHKRIEAIKDSGSPVSKSLYLHEKLQMKMLAGDDDNLLAYLANGGIGCVSVMANIIPRHMIAMYNAFIENEVSSARNMMLQIMNLMSVIFSMSNPIGIKCAMNVIGMLENELRMPLISANNEERHRVVNALKKAEQILQNEISGR